MLSGIATSAVVAGGRSPSSLACALLWHDVSRFSSLRLSLIFPVLMSTSSAPSKAKTLTLSPRGLNAYLFCGLLLSLSDFTRYVQDLMLKWAPISGIFTSLKWLRGVMRVWVDAWMRRWGGRSRLGSPTLSAGSVPAPVGTQTFDQRF